MENKDILKRFYCGTKDICFYKEHYVNNRCFADYIIRQCCPNIIRADGKTWKDGSKEEAVLIK
jgi:hypothetical protein